MELRDLRVFVRVVEAGGMTRAAREVHMAQSAVSAAVARLERRFGLPLLERRPEGVRPTPAGDLLAREAHGILAQVERTERAMAAHRGRVEGHVAIGVLPTLTPLVMSGVLRRLIADHPGLEVRVEEGPERQLIEGVKALRIDIAVLWRSARSGWGPEEGLPLVVVAATGRAPAAAGSTAFDGLAEGPWVVFPDGGPGRRWLTEACEAVGAAPRIAASVATLGEMVAFVRAGAGLALLPEATVDAEVAAGQLEVVRLLEPAPRAHVRILDAAHGADPVLAAVRSAVRAEIRARASAEAMADRERSFDAG